MRLETRSFPQNDGTKVEQLLLVLETEHESKIVDSFFGSRVDPDGLIARGAMEVRLSDGYGQHYIRMQRSTSLDTEGKSMQNVKIGADFLPHVSRFAFPVEGATKRMITVERTMSLETDSWAIRWDGRRLTIEGSFSYEPQPSSRTDAYIAGATFTLAQALPLAQRIASAGEEALYQERRKAPAFRPGI